MGHDRTPKQVAAYRRTLAAGGTLKDALKAAGYSDATADKGRAALPKELAEVTDRIQSVMAKGREYTADQRAALARGALIDSIEQNRDLVQAAKQLGSEKDVNMWVADQTGNQILIQLPEGMAARFAAAAPPMLDAEVVDTPRLSSASDASEPPE
jgi:hypothetical protein